jgi:hypothetical protein
MPALVRSRADQEGIVQNRSMWMRFAVLAVVLAVAAPVWATEIQMREKKDPKAEQKQDPAKDAEKKDDKDLKKTQPCPLDNMTFNTLEDMYGFLGTVDALTLQQTQQAEQAKLPVAEGAATPQEVEWRAVQQPEGAKKEAKAETKKAD